MLGMVETSHRVRRTFGILRRRKIVTMVIMILAMVLSWLVFGMFLLVLMKIL